MGGMLAGSFLGAMAGTVLGTAIANSFFDGAHGDLASGAHDADAAQDGFDQGVADNDFGGDFGGDSFDV